MRVRVSVLFVLCLIGLGVNPSLQAASLVQAHGYQIKLRSRQFTPSPGVEDAVRRQMQTQSGTQHVIVQLPEFPNDAERAGLRAQGIHLLNYLPDHAYFAAIDATASIAAVRWLGAIHVADKLPARLLTGSPLSHALDSDGVLTLRLYYFDDVAEPDAIAVVRQHAGVVVQSDIPYHALAVRLALSAVNALAAEDSVRWLEEAPPPPTVANDSIRAKMRVDLVQAAPYNLNGAGTVLGIWDCGAIGPHADFTGRLTNIGGQLGSCAHATHVAGTMAGSGANSVAQGGTPFQWRGVAPGAQIIAYDFLNTLVETQDAISTYHIDLSQNSWNFLPSGAEDCHDYYGNYNHLAPEYDQVVTGIDGKRIPVLFVAGNTQNVDACAGFGTVTPPGTAKNVLTVGATNANDDSMTFFSSWGPTDDGRTKPDVVAPGCRSDVGYPNIVSTVPTDTYGTLCGTSMSTPAVSGLLALLLQQIRQSGGPTTPLPSTLKALVIHGAVDLGNPGPDYQFGWGRADAKNSVDLARDGKYRESQLNDSQVLTYTANVLSCDSQLKVTLVWDDPAAMQNAAPTLVNDLDLALISPLGVISQPWTQPRVSRQ